MPFERLAKAPRRISSAHEGRATPSLSFTAVRVIGLALLGLGFLGQADGSWRHLISLCVIILSVPAGIASACLVHRFSIVEGLAGDVGYEDLEEKHDD